MTIFQKIKKKNLKMLSICNNKMRIRNSKKTQHDKLATKNYINIILRKESLVIFFLMGGAIRNGIFTVTM